MRSHYLLLSIQKLTRRKDTSILSWLLFGIISEGKEGFEGIKRSMLSLAAHRTLKVSHTKTNSFLFEACIPSR